MDNVDGYGVGACAGERPPLGLVPRGLWVEHRIKAIREAIGRYTAAKKAIPQEWIDEYNELVDPG